MNEILHTEPKRRKYSNDFSPKKMNFNSDHVSKQHHYLSDKSDQYQLVSCHDSPGKVIDDLIWKFNDFKQILCYTQQHDDKTIIHWIDILSHIITCNEKQRELGRIIRLLFSEANLRGFFFSLTTFIRCIPMETDKEKRIHFPRVLKGVIALFDRLLDTNAVEAAKHLPVDVCIGTAQQLSLQAYCYQEINEKAQLLLQKRNEICSTFTTDSEENDCYPLSVALPLPEELHNEPERKQNITDKPFPNNTDYLKIQSDLLREDFINPLRVAIIESRSKTKSKGLKFTNVMFSGGQVITSSGTCAHKLSFEVSRKGINWNRNKSLLYGSLVCLSEDNFKTVLYATIAERKVEDLEQGQISVEVQGYNKRLLSPTKKFVMIESPGYFEAFAPVIKRLKKIEPEKLRFAKYLVQLQRKVDCPAYLRKRRAIYNMKGVVCDCDSSDETCSHSQVDILDENVWQSMDTPTLDASQKNALHLALTNELALIQGPPGTGKTYIGLKVVQALLQNSYFWKYRPQGITCPILVVCYTNHALDQFLEQVIELPNAHVVRLGGQSKSEKVKKFTLWEKAHEACRKSGVRFYNPMKSRQLDMTNKQVEALQQFLSGNFVSKHSPLYCKILSQETLEDLEVQCDIKLFFPGLLQQPLGFASWLDEDIQRKVEFYNQSQNEDLIDMNEDRYCDDDNFFEARDLYAILCEEDLKAFVQRFGSVHSLSEETATQWLHSDHSHQLNITVSDKLRLFKYCLENLLKVLQKKQQISANEQRVYDMKMNEVKLKCLQEANVIGLTTTAAARDNVLLSKVESKIMIVEEAAEVLEPQVIATLTEHTQHVVLIGDHKQLRPKTNDYTIGHKYKLEISMFERLVRNGLPHAMLVVQHRMRPEISQIVSDHIYQKKLQDHKSTMKYKNVRGIKKNLFFINHNKEEAPKDIDLHSHSNVHEATFLASLCNYLLQQEYSPEQITVITPYVGQLYELRSQFKQKDITNVRITTIDNYQGEENDIVLLSLVRSNKERRAGFVKDDNRICVALSRAKCGLYCIGNFSLLQECSQQWSSIVEDLKAKMLLGDNLQLYCTRHEVEIEVSCADDFAQVPDGGCSEPCEGMHDDCGHECQRRCHPDDRDHTAPCKHPCTRRCPENHLCKRLCYEVCGKCREVVYKVIPSCNHKQRVPCHMPPELFSCKAPCEKPLPCGHPCDEKCFQTCSDKCTHKVKRKLVCGHEVNIECYLNDAQALRKCAALCGKELACGHLCSGTCGGCKQGRLHAVCKKSCTRLLPCGHKCSAKCNEPCKPCKSNCAYSCSHGWCGHKCNTQCKPCTDPCEWRCRHKKCSKTCGEICDREKCDKPCTERLKCGHPCLGLCGEQCPPVCHQCGTVREKVCKIYRDEQCHEKKAGHRYIELEDCHHIFSVESLDRWMEERQDQAHPGIVDWKRCPIEFCRRPVMTTPRYANIAKQILQKMNELKLQREHFLLPQIRKQMFDCLLEIPDEELKAIRLKIPPIKKSDNDVTLQKQYVCTLSAIETHHALSDIEKLISDIKESLLVSNKVPEEDIASLELLQSQASDFLAWIKDHQPRGVCRLTEQMILDMTAEKRRLILLKKYYTLKYFPPEEGEIHEMDEDDKLLMEILSKSTASKRQDEHDKIELLQCVLTNPYQRLSLTRLERQDILYRTGASSEVGI